MIENAWRDVINDAGLCDFASYQEIQWKVIVELAPWMGRVYERLVGLIKRALRKIIGTKCLSKIQLVTVLTEVEAWLKYYTDPYKFLFYLYTHSMSSLTWPMKVIRKLTLQRRVPLNNCLSFESVVRNTWTNFGKYGKQKVFVESMGKASKIFEGSHCTVAATPKVGDVVLIKEDLPRGANRELDVFVSWYQAGIRWYILLRSLLLLSSLSREPSVFFIPLNVQV